MTTKTEPIIEENDDGTIESHPSYGMVVFHRVQGSPRFFFGSEVQGQGTYISLEIKEGERHHDGKDYYMGRKHLIRIRMTASQFAQLLTTMNMGDGVPCTIERVWKDGKYQGVEAPPVQKKEIERVEEHFRQRLSKFTQDLDAGRQRVLEILEQKTIKKSDRQEIKSLLDMVMREVASNTPYMIRLFRESTETIVEQAKAEVDSFVTTVAMKTGLGKLKQLALGAGNVESDTEGED